MVDRTFSADGEEAHSPRWRRGGSIRDERTVRALKSDALGASYSTVNPFIPWAGTVTGISTVYLVAVKLQAIRAAIALAQTGGVAHGGPPRSLSRTVELAPFFQLIPCSKAS